jgi:NAD(P)-dependent dehydrogenase (short-subunit alcohol dehydrogenase family)
VALRDLSGKVAFITGGASGLGFGMARAFAEAGMKLILTDIDAGTLAKAAEELEKAGAEVAPVVLDIADRPGWERAADAGEKRLGKIHVLCNQAGITAHGWDLDQIPFDVWDTVIKINLTGGFNGIHTVVPRIKAHGQGGHVVNTSSISGVRGRAGHAVYCAAKHGVIGMSESLRDELEPYGIGVSVYCPGNVATRLKETSEKIRELSGLAPAPGPRTNQPTLSRAYNVLDAGRAVLRAIEDNAFFILTHPEYRGFVEKRYQLMMQAFAVSEHSA